MKNKIYAVNSFLSIVAMLLILESFSSTGKILDYAATQSKGVISEKKLDDMIFGAENHQELERRAHVILRSYTSCLQLRRSTAESNASLVKRSERYSVVAMCVTGALVVLNLALAWMAEKKVRGG